MKINRLKLLAAGLLFLVYGCSPSPVVVDFDNVCEYDYVTITGKLHVSGMQTKRDVYSLVLKDVSVPFDQQKILPVWIRVGNSRDRIEYLPSFYNDSDVRIHTDVDEILGDGETVILTGSVMADDRGFAGQVPCRLYEVDRIELP